MSQEKNKKRIQIFRSFEEAEAAELKDKSERTGTENLAIAVELIKKLYDYKPQKYYRIYFDKV